MSLTRDRPVHRGSIAAVLAVTTALAPAMARPAITTGMQASAVSMTEPDPASAELELEAGVAAYAEGDYATALRRFEQAYALYPDPDYLYAWAQAARSAGDCATAVELYRRFIESEPSRDPLEAARRNQARCAEQLAADRSQPEREPSLEPTTPDPAPPSIDERRGPDPVGLSLLVPGSLAMATGTALLAVAGARERTQANQTSYQAFHDLNAGIDRLYVAGAVTLGVGAALAVAGAIRLAVRARSGSRGSGRAVLVPAFDPRGTTMLVLRFAVGGRRRSSDR